jgi:hypothetical protein
MRPICALLGVAVFAVSAAAQEAQSGLVAPICVQGIGECRNVMGLRLALRDRNLQRVVGVNITAWMPHKPTTGTIKGLAIGLPATGSEYISGIAVAPAIITARTRITGIAVAGFATAVAGEVQALSLSGVGSAYGEDVTGIAVSGVGIAAGGNVSGIFAAGIGGAIGGRLNGMAIAGMGMALNNGGSGIIASAIGSAIGGAFTGLAVGGLGLAGGGSLTGITLAGIGVGIGQQARGLIVAGLGAAAGEEIDGIAIAGLGLASPRIEKLAIAAVVAANDASGIVIAPAYFRAHRQGGDGSAHGVFVSAMNDVRGELNGVAIGLINFARSLNGVQLGLINIVADGRSPRILPLVNWR